MQIVNCGNFAIVNDKYIVNKKGEVFTILKRKIKKQKLRKHTNGYLRATINGNDFYVHRLVAICFVPNSEGFNEISHEDNDKTNNNVENLKWCSRNYNNKKIFIDKIRTNEEMRAIAKLPKLKARLFNDEQIKNIKNLILDGKSDTEISKMFNCSRGCIYGIRKGRAYNE